MPFPYAHSRQQAQSLAEAGDVPAARAVLEGAVSSGRAGLAEGDPELLETMRQLAGLHVSAGDPAAARRVLEEAVAAVRTTDQLGVMLAFDLAVVAADLGNRHVARTQFARVAELGPAVLGEDHWAVDRARAFLGAATDDAPAPVSSPPPVSPAPLFAPPVSAPPEPVTAVPAFAPTPPSPARRHWLPAALGGVVGGVIVAVVVAVVVLRPGDDEPASTAATQPVPSVPSAAPSPVPTPSAPVPSSAAPSTTPPRTSAAVKPTTAKPTTAVPSVRTKIVAPAPNSKVPYPFDARFTVAKSDAGATDTVVALLICVAGRCYLDGKLDMIEGTAAPYTIYLGSTRPEGTGVAWKLRLDRLPESTFTKLIAARDAAIADGTWGDKGTPMSALNPAPLSTVTVVKG
ncbi:hypothetical protein KOI35_21260 [Actinoplanes bogorensis]|uniref:Tetratricopeptide repeat protein n=1 Tax=Paractinoplanes bogorensis TaxID=1610840 RepID=A0ABS5YRV2_9ACTN|nr:tetratricopeptide repeat protein [Actinoplanes bogorensis]MBU2666046.1 hypothetical protein [Actinoplanes bogorensis]